LVENQLGGQAWNLTLAVGCWVCLAPQKGEQRARY
jgi:hypothetical protein